MMRGQLRGRGRGGHTPSTTLYKCSLGGEMKPLHEFSSNQHQRAGIGRRRIDPLACGMICKEHANGPRQQLRCEACYKVLPLDRFSKTTRRNDENVCIQCRSWYESEPTPRAANHDDFDDEETEFRVVFPDMNPTPASTAKDDDITTLAVGTLDVSTSTIGASQDLRSEDTYEGYMPKHLRVNPESTATSVSVIDILHVANDQEAAPKQATDDLSSIAPNEWYAKATGLRASECKSPAVGLWVDKARRFLEEETVKTATPCSQADKSVSAWDDDGRSLPMRPVDANRRPERLAQVATGRDTAGGKAKLTTDLLRPTKASFKNQLAWLDAQPEGVLDDAYASDHEN